MKTPSNHEKRVPVQRISIPWILEVVSAIDELKEIKFKSIKEDCLYILFNAQLRLEELFDFSIYRPFLRISRQEGQLLHE